jgi:DNA-binding transcriptional ArsR family regulator
MGFIREVPIVSGVLLAPGAVEVRFALDPVYNNLASLYQLHFADTHPQLDEWVRRTVSRLSAEEMRTQTLLTQLLYSAYEPDVEWPSFPAYLDHLAGQDPARMRDRCLAHMFPDLGRSHDLGDQLMDLETFVAEIDRSEFDIEVDDELFAEAHSLLGHPPALRDRIVLHLTAMWHQVLAPEWARHKAALAHIVDALQRRAGDYAGQTAYEAIQSVTGRDVRGTWQRVLGPAKTLVLIPCPHIGPYLMHYAYVPIVRVIYGAHPPPKAEGGAAAPDHAALLVQLRTLADETRLHILELLLDEGELCAQEIITRLQLTKSAASRHLSQLSAAGYLMERQGTGKAKCYTLNRERFQATLRLLKRFA